MNLRGYHQRLDGYRSISYRLLRSYLYDQRPQHNGTEDRVVEDPLKDVSLAVNLPGVQLVKDLHEDEGVEDDGVMLRRGGVKRGVPPVVDFKHPFACERRGQMLLSRWLYTIITFYVSHIYIHISCLWRVDAPMNRSTNTVVSW